MTTTQAIMTVQEVADRYYELAQRGQIGQIQDELYAPNAVSLEPENRSNLPRRVEGLAAMKQKEQQFYQLYEQMHGGECGKPVVSGDYFACAQSLDVTQNGQRKNKHQLAVFEVVEGKIVREEFFYKE
ncbi:nuclear transport factor 2 family protein [Hymenobacter armeniacus]|uniref:Nuclear transport factor 2 family protein n=1 Tax=Hymenobacter armeniacus TaxID=2771358 RepID=A0ABR8JXY5_9BACT|nr:nuclear transport factor 2 family protein [Hymenobacter armeniacus]MBD2723661.1 nuclear transport factor 2 family protein [Hymenobacter armeniacus]